ncbi:MAG: SURF1 family protein [Alphaproteobacteria bacterium]|nr:SURF1 family protein [Alphaproteobacteria bacterium]HPF46520.1 SURF1 family protein [Emcibacteraceae bacterium]
MFPYSFKPRLWPTLISIILLACLLWLGNWQVERLEWKLGLIKQIENRAYAEPVTLPATLSNPEDMEYLSVKVTGKFSNDQEMTLYSVGPNGEAGYDLYTPFADQSGKIIIINRGWVPERMKNQQSRPETLESDIVTVAGLLRAPVKKLWYGPENDPDNNNWYYGNLNAMISAQNLTNVFPMFLYAVSMGNNDGFPIAGRTELNIVNNHLDYALTWYGLAIVLVIIYLIAHLKKKEK